MKYLRKFNESIEDEIYQQVLDTIKDCFVEFEDAGWFWVQYTEAIGSRISNWSSPNFNCRMMVKEDEYIPADLRDYIDWSGEINSNGQIIWDTKVLDFNDETSETEKAKVMTEAEDFLIAVKRIYDETGIDFRFSYNNRGGEKRIIIQGRI